jgi:predicted amino acid-binding ACT domain protein
MESIIDFVDCLAILKKYNKEQLFLQLLNENKELKNENKHFIENNKLEKEINNLKKQNDELKNENNKNESLLFIKNIINTVCIIELENDNKNFKELNEKLENKNKVLENEIKVLEDKNKVLENEYKAVDIDYYNAIIFDKNKEFKKLNKKLKELNKKLKEKNINIKKQNEKSDKEKDDKEEDDKEKDDKEKDDKEEDDKEESDKEEDDEEAEDVEDNDNKEENYLKFLENKINNLERENDVLENENEVLENENEVLENENKILENENKFLENEILENEINDKFLVNFENYLNQIINFYINIPIDKINHWLDNNGENINESINEKNKKYKLIYTHADEYLADVYKEKSIWHKEFVENYQKILDDYRNKKFYIINSFNIFIKSMDNIDTGLILFINNYGCIYGFNIIRDQWDKIICCYLPKFHLRYGLHPIDRIERHGIAIDKSIFNYTFNYESKLSPNKIKLISKLPFILPSSQEQKVLFSYLNFIYTNG